MLSLDKITDLKLPTNNCINITNKKSNHSQSENSLNVLHLRSFAQQNIQIRTFSNINYNGTWNMPSSFKKINDIYEGNFVDEILTNAGNENRPKRSKDPNRRNKTSRKGESIEKQNVLRGFCKSDDKVLQVVPSFDKNNDNYIGKLENLNLGVTLLGVQEDNYIISDNLRKHRFDDNCYLDEESKDAIRDTLNFKYGHRLEFIEEVLNSNLIEEPTDGFKDFYYDIVKDDKYTTFLDLLRYLLVTSYTYYSPGLTKVVCLDVDYDSNILGTLKRMAIFENFKDTKCLIISNKETNIKKKNHMTVVIFFKDFICYENAKRIRNVFKLAGMCDKGMNNYGTKNPFNLDRFDVYYNKEGNLSTGNMPMVEELLQLYKNTLNIEDTDEIYNVVKNEENMKKINFTCTDSFKAFVDKYSMHYNYEIEKLTLFEKKKEKQEKEKKESTEIGYTEFCKFIMNKQPTKEKLLAYNKQIIFRKHNRRKHCYNFGKMIGKCFKANLTWKECFELFNRIVIVEDPEGKHEHSLLIRQVKEGYEDGRLEIKEYIDERLRNIISGTLGSLTTNANNTASVVLDIIETILNEIDKGTKLRKIRSIAKKNHKKYGELVNKLVNCLCYCNTTNKIEIKLRLKRIGKEWLHTRTTDNIAETCRGYNINEKEISKRITDAETTIDNGIEEKNFDKIIILVKKTISKHINNMNDCYYFFKEFKDKIRTLFKKNQWCLIE